MGKTVKKRQNAETMKPEIVFNFYKTILEDGLEGASIGKVAKRMKIHPSLIIHYFQTKDNLIAAMVDYLIEGAGRLYDMLNTQADDSDKRLRNLVSIFFSDAWYHMTDAGVDFAVLSLSGRDELVDLKLRNLYELTKKHIANEIKKLNETGILSVKDPLRAAEMIITIYEGYRHFKHFYVAGDQAESFRNDMIDKVLSMLKN